MSNKIYWDQIKQPPPEALKPIQAGRLKGKSDISPMWRFEAMTDLFGPCGQGWGYDIEKLWTEEGANGEKMAFAEIKLWYKPQKEGSALSALFIPGIGGSKITQKESSGMYNNDEGYKMAVTDALGVAMKALGMAADVYAGKWDGSKYLTGNEPTTAEKNQVAINELLEALPDDVKDIFRAKKATRAEVIKKCEELGWDYDRIRGKYGTDQA